MKENNKGLKFYDNLDLSANQNEKELLDVYKKWASIYDKDNDDLLGTVSQPNSVQIFHKYIVDKNQKIIDVGCGTGLVGLELQKLGYTNFDGIDISKDMIDIAIDRGYQTLFLGNLNAKRDWGYAPEFVEGMWMMMQQDTPDDWVLATGEAHSVKEFLEEAFNQVNLNWEDYVEISERHFRPNEVEHLLGDASKAKKELGWSPETSFDQLVEEMIDYDLKLAKQEMSTDKSFSYF